MKKTIISLALAAAFILTACNSTPVNHRGHKMSQVSATPDIIVGTNNVIKWQYKQVYLKGNQMSAFVIGDTYIYRQITFSNGVAIADERFPNPNFPTQ
jgi:predicted small secreted protein